MTTTTQALERHTIRPLVEGLGALVVLVGGLVGIPVILATTVGWPLPHHLPSAGQIEGVLRTTIPDSFWPHLFAALGWLAWAYFAFSVTSCLLAHVRGVGANRRLRLGSHSAAALVSAVMSAVIVLGQFRAASAERVHWRRTYVCHNRRAARGRHRRTGERATRHGGAHGGGR